VTGIGWYAVLGLALVSIGRPCLAQTTASDTAQVTLTIESFAEIIIDNDIELVLRHPADLDTDDTRVIVRCNYAYVIEADDYVTWDDPPEGPGPQAEVTIWFLADDGEGGKVEAEGLVFDPGAWEFELQVSALWIDDENWADLLPGVYRGHVGICVAPAP